MPPDVSVLAPDGALMMHLQEMQEAGEVQMLLVFVGAIADLTPEVEEVSIRKQVQSLVCNANQ